MNLLCTNQWIPKICFFRLVCLNNIVKVNKYKQTDVENNIFFLTLVSALQNMLKSIRPNIRTKYSALILAEYLVFGIGTNVNSFHSYYKK